MEWCNVEYNIFFLYKWIKLPKGLAVAIVPFASKGSINMSLSHVPKSFGYWNLAMSKQLNVIQGNVKLRTSCTSI